MSDRTTTTATVPVDTGGVERVVHLLRCVHPAAAEGARFLDGGPLTVGRVASVGVWPIDDREASRQHAIFEFDRRFDAYSIRDLGSRNGTFVGGERCDRARLVDGSVVRIGQTVFVYCTASFPVHLAPTQVPPGVALRRDHVERLADLAAPSTLPVLVCGPTGAGKERLATRLHESSGRRGPLVSLNCATIPRDLVASELFGHVRGAFSGAQQARKGLFVSAAGGTLFLDEVGELPLDQQPALLRALQERRVRPVGSDHEVDVDVRVVAATHRDLDALIESGDFRRDLLMRLRGVTLTLPPLSQRRDEVLAIARTFLGHDRIAADAATALLLYDWPGNVRELQHLAEQVRIFSGHDGELARSDLPEAVRDRAPTGAPRPGGHGRPTHERLHQLARAHAGNVSRIARDLGVHRQQAYRWLEACGIDIAAYRPTEPE